MYGCLPSWTNSQWESFKRVREINELKDAAKKSCYALYEMILTFNALKYISINVEVKLKRQSWFNYILVDEFQDTNEDQFELLNHLIRNKENIFILVPKLF